MLADLALLNGDILTMKPSMPHAQAVAIKDDKIIRVGTNQEVSTFVGKNTKIIDLDGKAVLPGFIDTHIHVVDFGRFLTWLNLQDVKSIDELQSKLKERVHKTPKGKWIIGNEWNQERFAEKRPPTRLDLDTFSPDNPVIFYHENRQLCVLNSKALALAGITGQTESPQGGTIEKDAKGEPTGILQGNAADLVWRVIPEPTEDELAEAASLACQKLVEAGVTSVHWMASSKLDLSIIQKLKAENKLPVRVYAIISVDMLDTAVKLDSKVFGVNKSMARIGGVEIFADGFLSSKTAALFEPYNDEPAANNKGTLMCTQEELNTLTAKVCKANLQVVIHAMGDQAADMALTAIEKAFGTTKNVARPRIDQAAVTNQKIIQRLKKLNVVASVQPLVMASEFSMWSAVERLGPQRARWLYPLKTLTEEGVIITGGSDCPMEPLNPLLGVQAAVTRQFYSEEQVSVEEALCMYTVNAAYSAKEENLKGSIEEGKLADLTVLSQSPYKTQPNELQNISIEMVLIGGKVVHSK